jgi:hypothetical protein
VTVRRHENGTIMLEGDCTAEEAEPLLQMLQDAPGGMLDWTTSPAHGGSPGDPGG